MAKVTYIVSDIHKAVFFEHTALLLRKAGIDLSFILINCRGGDLDVFLQAHRFRTYHLEVQKLLYSREQIMECARILRAEKPDAVHCHLSAANFVGIIAAFMAGVKKRIYTRHTGLVLDITFKEKIIDRIQNTLATTIVAITENTRAILIAQGVSEDKIKVVHHGFDIDRMINPDADEVNRIKQEYNPTNKYPLVGVIARWMKPKGIQYIIPAFQKLLHEYPDSKLCLFNANNSADYSSEIGTMLQALPVVSCQIVAFEKNIYDLYQLFDMYIHVPVHPNYEAFGQTYVEALAAGVPSIFTLSGVAREFISEDNAYIIDFENSDQIFTAMKAILNRQKDPAALKRNGQEIVKEMFSLDKYIAKLITLYQG